MGNRFSGDLEGVDFQGLHGSQGQYTIRLMALYIPHRCPKCFESVTLVQHLDKQDAPRGKAKGHCVICGWREEVAIYPNQKIYAGPVTCPPKRPLSL